MVLPQTLRALLEYRKYYALVTKLEESLLHPDQIRRMFTSEAWVLVIDRYRKW